MKSKMLCLLSLISFITACSNDDDFNQEIPPQSQTRQVKAP